MTILMSKRTGLNLSRIDQWTEGGKNVPISFEF